jgi:hypothetical protein
LKKSKEELINNQNVVSSQINTLSVPQKKHTPRMKQIREHYCKDLYREDAQELLEG